MALVVASSPSDELLSVEEAKRHLRILSGDMDDKVSSLIRAARDDCERATGRTFRKAVTRTYTCSEWWSGELVLPFPPLLGVTSIVYRDEDDSEQTLAAANYHAVLSTDGFGRVAWAANADRPSVYDRPDAISVTFSTGYADLNAVPPCAVQAIKLKITELYGAGTESELKAARLAATNLLNKIDATGYA